MDGDGLSYLTQPITFTVAIVIALILSSSHEKTAWNPKGMPSALLWTLGALMGIGSCVGLGYGEQHLPELPSDALLLGVAFVTTGIPVVTKATPSKRASLGSSGRCCSP